jgi:hypothetical protein
MIMENCLKKIPVFKKDRDVWMVNYNLYFASYALENKFEYDELERIHDELLAIAEGRILDDIDYDEFKNSCLKIIEDRTVSFREKCITSLEMVIISESLIEENTYREIAEYIEEEKKEFTQEDFSDPEDYEAMTGKKWNSEE